MLKRCLLAATLAVRWATVARADPALPEPPPQQTPAHSAALETGVNVDEVLRSARRELLSLLAKQAVTRDEIQMGARTESSIGLGAPPASLSSYIPKAPLVGTGPTPDVTWLRGLALPDIPVRWDDRLVRELDYYRTNPRGRALIRGLFTRQATYAAMIRAKLRAAQLPDDLQYIVMAESGFDTKARSTVGAAGLWQLMPAPATQYGLEMSKWVDARLIPEPCTDAALSFLRDVNRDLGSWPLSLAAFNMGYGALLRSIQKYNTNDYWLLSTLEAGLPVETVAYITRIMAYAIVGHNRARFGIADVPLESPITTATIDLPGGVTFSRIARVAGIDVASLAALNPELKKSRLPPDVKSWPVRVPRELAARFREKWAKQGPLVPAHRKHVMRLGERLSDIAEMYATTPAKLLKLNDLPDGASLRAGQKLLVPDVEPIFKMSPERAVVGIPPDTFVYADRRRVFYRVAPGDELEEIARFFHVSLDEIRVWNRIAGDAKLQRGMYLQLYVPHDAELSETLVLSPNQVRTLVVGSEDFFNFHEQQQNRVRIRYRVKPGDTLRSLAERFDLSIGSIARINQFGRETKLEPDSEIIIYVAQPSAAGVGAKASAAK